MEESKEHPQKQASRSSNEAESVDKTSPPTNEPTAEAVAEPEPEPKTEKPPQASVNDTSSLPDGGTQAWLQVVGAFFLFFNSWGIINAFGIYQTYYETSMLVDTSPAAISWVGTLQGFALMLVGPLTGPIYDAGYFRALIIGGTFLIVFGHMMLSLCSAYWQVLLAQAFCIGIGCGFLYVPSVAILSTYFQKNLPLAMGCASAGSSLGGIIYPVVLYRILPTIGFGWATRTLGFIALGTLLISHATMRVRVLPATQRKILDLSALSEPPYALFVAGVFFAFMTFYTPYFYVEYFSLTYHIADEQLSFYTLAILNAASGFGRVIPNYIAQTVGPMNVNLVGTAIAGILTLCLIPVRDTAPLVVLCILYGFFGGTIIGLPSTIFVHLSMHKRGMIGTRMGMGFAICSIGVLIGMPIAGWILDASSFTYVWLYGGIILLTGAIFLACARFAKVGKSNLFAVV